MFNRDNIMVCVTQQKTCERLISSGAALKKEIGSDLFVIHVVRERDNFLYNDSEPDALQYLFNVSKEAGAELTVLRSDDVVDTLKEFARDRSIGHIVLGQPPKSAKNCVVDMLKESSNDLKFHIIPAK
ncbi:MAG: universal stress protein [Clostridium sp.]|uniref:universal stress protein n=1 Tax=Clostridium sp. TaxID=1506 RepID=UPI002FC64A27